MPSTVRVSKNELLTMVRVKDGQSNRIDAYASTNNAATWTPRGMVADTGAFGGNPPMLFRLRDGRLCLTYGYRSEPYSVRARLSNDNGKTWAISAHFARTPRRRLGAREDEMAHLPPLTRNALLKGEICLIE